MPSSPTPIAPAPPAAHPPRELTARALAAGLTVGALLAVVNVSMGLETGWWDPGSVTASILAFTLLSGAARLGGRDATPLETNLAQTAAASAGAAPAAAGLLGAVPALALLGRPLAPALVAAFGLAVAILGALLALALRRRLLEEERLPFPTGVATAQVITTLHGGQGGGARALAVAVVVAAAATGLREAGVIPGALLVGGALAGAPAAAYGLGVATSPLLAGVGLVAGARAGLGVLAGAVVGWVALGPRLVASGAVAEASYGALAAWLAWPGVALLLGSALVALGAQARAVWRAPADLLSARRAGGPALALGAAAALGVALLGAVGFGMGGATAAGALALAVVLGAACARAAGQTDIAPAGEVGQAALAAARLAGAGPVAGVGAGAVVSGAAAQASAALWSLRAGALLGGRPRALGVAAVAGTVAGAAVAVPLYLVVVEARGLGSAALPAPGAVPWRALSAALEGGAAAIPEGAGLAALLALGAGVALELLARARGRGARWALPPGAVGLGFIVPASYAAALALGAVAGLAWSRWRPEHAARVAPLVGAGLIAGASVAGLVAALS